MKKRLYKDFKPGFAFVFLLGILWIILSIILFFIDFKAGGIAVVFTLTYYIIAAIAVMYLRENIDKSLVRFGEGYAQTQNQLLRNLDIPFAMCEADGKILWENKSFSDLFVEKNSETYLSKIFNEISSEKVTLKNKKDVAVLFKGRNYTLHIAETPVEVDYSEEQGAETNTKPYCFYSVYAVDETELLSFKSTLEAEKSVFALVYLDNYEEALEGIEDVRRSLLSALLERKINKYVASVDGIIRKLEKDRYFLVMKKQALWKMQEKKFSLLEDIKTVNIGNDMSVTISMGIGADGDTFEQNYEYARTAIDIALGRGGDQVVLKSAQEVAYYGGKAQSAERSTRVKARIKAHALRELIESKENVIVMGHPISDVDCLGAAIGIYRAAKTSGKRAYIVATDVSNSVYPLMDVFKSNAEYEEDLFITGEEAMKIIGKESLLVVVDTNRPTYTVCPELLEAAASIVVMDHHRMGREKIENAVLSYVEPYASSASEMVAEVIQYYSDDLKLRSIEADAIYAGIVIDTNNFVNKTGVRTFEAAAYLRRNGADVTRVRKLLRDELRDYKLRAETVSRAEILKDGYVISTCPPGASSENLTVVAAQAANELLEIRGIKASFVLSQREQRVYISARSIDEVNVQVIMEKLGGGGHLSVAGAQLNDTTLEDAVTELKKVLEDYEINK